MEALANEFLRTLPEEWWIYPVVYVATLVVGHQLTGQTVDAMWRQVGWSGHLHENHEPRRLAWHPRAVGVLEIPLYTSAVLLGRSEFIAVWLGLKIGGTWKRWEEDRSAFNIFLIGNGLNITYGVTGAAILKCLLADEFATAILLGLAVILSSGAFSMWARRLASQPTIDSEKQEDEAAASNTSGRCAP